MPTAICSLRLDPDCFLVCAAMPMGLIRDQPGVVVPVQGRIASGGSRRKSGFHQAIYERRGDVCGRFCRIMPATSPWRCVDSVPGAPGRGHGLGAYFQSGGRPCGMIPDCFATRSTAAAVAAQLGRIQCHRDGALMARIVVADGLEKAVVLSWFLEDSARIEREGAGGWDFLRNPAASVRTRSSLARYLPAGGVVETHVGPWLNPMHLMAGPGDRLRKKIG